LLTGGWVENRHTTLRERRQRTPDITILIGTNTASEVGEQRELIGDRLDAWHQQFGLNPLGDWRRISPSEKAVASLDRTVGRLEDVFTRVLGGLGTVEACDVFVATADLGTEDASTDRAARCVTSARVNVDGADR